MFRTTSAVVLLSTRGLARGARDAIGAFARAGGGILIAASPDVEPSCSAACSIWQAGALGCRGETWTGVRCRLRISAILSSGRSARSPPISGRSGSNAHGDCRPDGWDVAARFTRRHTGAARADARARAASSCSRPTSIAAGTTFRCIPHSCRSSSEAVRYVSGHGERLRDYLVSGVPAACLREARCLHAPGPATASSP